VITGGGFAGLSAVKTVSRQPVDVILIDRRYHHTFQPLLYQAALGVLSAGDIAQPDIERITIGSGSFVQYEYLVIVSAATHSCFGNDSWESDAPGLKSIDVPARSRSERSPVPYDMHGATECQCRRFV
jgi:NADH dehydrogenase